MPVGTPVWCSSGPTTATTRTSTSKLLNRIITDFGDVPVVLVTVSEYREQVREVNEVLEALLDVYDNLSIVDWHTITDASPELLNEDGIHPTTRGREVLAEAVADHLGPAPATPGKCLDSVFTDDSAGTIDGRPKGSGQLVRKRVGDDDDGEAGHQHHDHGEAGVDDDHA